MSITGQADSASITINSPQRHLQVGSDCEVVLGGTIVFANDWSINISNVEYSVSVIEMTMSASRDTMLGYAYVSGIGNASITAVKRVP